MEFLGCSWAAKPQTGWQRGRIAVPSPTRVRTKMLPDDRLVSGAKVRVHSLQSAAHAGRNGSFGVLGQFILESERWPVHFETEQGQPPAVLALRAANLEFVAPPQRRRYGPGGAFEWPARVHPNDDLVGLSPTVLKDPHEFTPVPGTEGIVERWGLEIPDQMAMMIRKMQTQSFYDTSFGGGLSCKTPEQQWVELRRRQNAVKSRAGLRCWLRCRMSLRSTWRSGSSCSTDSKQESMCRSARPSGES